MAKDFSFPFYVNNWLGGTMYLTFEQKGAYLELLLLQFNKGHFTETQVKQVLNTSYSSVWPVLLEKFKTDGSYFWNERMDEVKEERQNFINSRKSNRLGKKRITSVNHVNNTSKTLDKHMEGEGESKDNSKGKGKGVRGKQKFQKPELIEVIEYFKTKGFNETGAKKAFDYYESANWHDKNGDRVISWKQKMIANWMRDEYKLPEPAKQHQGW